jgi:DNA-binding LytR/AlgR family response regulator
MAKILVIEDELIIAHEIKRTLLNLGHEPVEDIIDNSEDTFKFLKEQTVDLILMDIHIKGETDGIATTILINEKYKIPVIFLTAFSDDQTLSRAKVAQPYGYIVKPFQKNALKASIEIALYRATQTHTASCTPTQEITEVDLKQPQAFFVKKGNKFVKIAVTDILWIKALDNYVCLYTEKDEYIVYSTLKEIEQRLPEQFFKTHRSFLVNLDKIDGFEESYILIGKKAIPVSRTSKEELKKRILFL